MPPDNKTSRDVSNLDNRPLPVVPVTNHLFADLMRGIATLILRWPFNVIDHNYINRPLLWFKFQPKLLLKCRE